MYRSVRLVCFSLNEARTLKAKTLTYGLAPVKSPFETCFLEVKANMSYVRYCNSGEN